jgi:hypothetical protein
VFIADVINGTTSQDIINIDSSAWFTYSWLKNSVEFVITRIAIYPNAFKASMLLKLFQ